MPASQQIYVKFTLYSEKNLLRIYYLHVDNRQTFFLLRFGPYDSVGVVGTLIRRQKWNENTLNLQGVW